MTVIVILAGIIIVFHVGEEFGYKKAELMDNMSDNYYRAFGPGDPHKMGAFGYLFDDQTGTHGVAGKVISISSSTILVEDKGGIEKTVITDDDTIIKKQRTTITTNDIKPNDFIIVIGSPTTNGEIDAKIIRTLPPPHTDTSITATGTSSNTN